MAVFAVQLAGICTRPASREALRRAAVKPRPTGISPYAPARTARSPGSRGTAPCASREARRRAAVISQSSCMSYEQPRALWARCGVQGGERKRVPSGHNRRRRLATGSRQPKRGFGTAVPKTTIEVADHCPLLEEDADHAAVAFVDDLAEGLLHFFLSVHGHPHQLVGKALPDQFV